MGFDACGIARSRPLDEQREGFLAWLDAGCDGGLAYLARNLSKRFDPARLVDGARSVIVCAVSYNRGFSKKNESILSANHISRHNIPQSSGCVKESPPEPIHSPQEGTGCGCLNEDRRTQIVPKNAPEIAPEGDQPARVPRIASYALTRDYHLTLREKLDRLLAYIHELGGTGGRIFVDTAPILEKAWAVEAGVGRIGRNSLLIHPTLGSFVLLGLVVTDLELDPDAPLSGNPCRACRRCMEQCPTGALRGDCTLDARRCISRHTIEKQTTGGATGSEPSTDILPATNAEPTTSAGLTSNTEPSTDAAFSAGTAPPDLHGWIFGCDICQRACPHNAKAPVIGHDFMAPVEGIENLTVADWQAMTEEEFNRRFGETPLARAGLKALKKRLPLL